ncbi:hypothetical protein QNH46_12075 [Paenibacillus woosongensis]|uniref:Uncharacterized protein n=1 Tax=Paenibacillus woosongensis TaxID=307580 RepID=A0AA95L3B5_9BACL|nr:hypothetical protein [Paenibacillus woosongensis]WHX51327.1 hypothetical protein QNH46_12075 [Paenibacillus woosongensis]
MQLVKVQQNYAGERALLILPIVPDVEDRFAKSDFRTYDEGDIL